MDELELITYFVPMESNGAGMKCVNYNMIRCIHFIKFE
jgi:hypothetical protein